MRDGAVVKGVKFRNHRVVGNIVELAQHYSARGADELVFYDITASPEGRVVDRKWVRDVAEVIDIPFCVAGGIRSVNDAEQVLLAGADKISVNTPAISNPSLISELARRFGSQCVVVGIDSLRVADEWVVCQLTGDAAATEKTQLRTKDWVETVQQLGAGEIVLNCMNQDGVRRGYDLDQIRDIVSRCNVPLVASGGAGSTQDFHKLFASTQVSAALAASVFHDAQIDIRTLKRSLGDNNIEVRL